MVDELQARIRERIRREGPLTFAAFMRMALYEPALGYYTSGVERVGAAGDFYTSPSAHPAFAALLGLQLEQLWRALGRPQPFVVLEVGAGKGLLRDDLLAFLDPLAPECVRAVDHVPVDLGHPLPGKGWPTGPFAGCVLSNELLDALPFHRLKLAGGRLQELYVVLGDDGLAERWGEPSDPALGRYLEEEGIALEEGQETEVCLEAAPLLERVARLLDRGLLITIDYGELAAERHSPRRRRGTALCYYRHGTNEEFLQRIGQQDITAHVDFTALLRAGQRAGLGALGFLTQAEFLRNLGLQVFEALLRRRAPPPQQQANLLGLRELVRPDGLGRFRVLVQGRGIDASQVDGLRYDPQRLDRLEALGDRLPLPLLHQAHTPLLTGRYPDAGVDWGAQLAQWLEEGAGPPPAGR